MEYSLEAKVVLDLEFKKDSKTSSHRGTRFNLDVSENLDREIYLEDGLPTKIGAKALTITLIQGLVGNIHVAHQKGYWNDADHLRYIISELEKGFVENADISTSTF